jgi:TRAP-type mannitol/chloroaromatic compound transport system permease small subunit
VILISQIVDRVDCLVGRIVAATQWLALPLVILLFLQWPLRDIFGAYGREANDLGQVIFGLLVAVSVTAATRAGTHLAADTLAQRYSDRTRHNFKRAGSALGLLPWAGFILVSSRQAVWSSVYGLEAFSDTSNPGYFIIKLALWAMAATIAMQCVVDILRPYRPSVTISPIQSAP